MITKNIIVENLPFETRIDRWLTENYHIPASLIHKFIRTKKITVNNKKVQISHRIKNQDTIEIKANISVGDPPRGTEKVVSKNLYDKLLAKIKDNILLKDANTIIINKPYNIAVQGGSKIKISIDDILDGLKFEYKDKARLVHRLDRHTTGILILARTKEAAKNVAVLFKEKKITKKYLAVVVGCPNPLQGVVKSYIAKTCETAWEKASNTQENQGKMAITEYQVVQNFGRISLVEFTPITGRTHQIRVHAAENLKTPIIGDNKYGGKKAAISGIIDDKMHLHSHELIIKDLAGKSYHIKAELPEHIRKTLDIFKS